MYLPRIKDIVRTTVRTQILLTVNADATVVDAAKKMSENQVGCLIVMDSDNRFVGVLSERDMLAKVLTQCTPAQTVKVREIMTTETVHCTMKTSLEEAEALMAKHRIRHLPIIEGNTPVGMISTRDLIAYRLDNSKAAKDAAEHIAMLTTSLKSLEFEDVIRLAMNQVPESFGAGCASLYLNEEVTGEARLFRHGCSAPKKCFEAAENGTRPKFYDRCPDSDNATPFMILPLAIHTKLDSKNCGLCRRSFMCIGRFRQVSPESEHVLLYKASLMQEILSGGLNNARIYSSYRQARRESETDPLTGAKTRRAMERIIKEEFERSKRYHSPFSLAILDLDNFKDINDSAGHAAGDMVLKTLAETASKMARKTDMVFRFGGDEFVLVLPETRLEDAREILERLRATIDELVMPYDVSTSISCGVTSYHGFGDETVDDIMAKADAALYKAKKRGRNCVVAAAINNKVPICL